MNKLSLEGVLLRKEYRHPKEEELQCHFELWVGGDDGFVVGVSCFGLSAHTVKSIHKGHVVRVYGKLAYKKHLAGGLLWVDAHTVESALAAPVVAGSE